MGRDGADVGDHTEIARDAYAYTLGYFEDDYLPIGSDWEVHPLRVRTYDYEYGTGAVGDALYNGNIAHTTYANRQFEGGDVAPSHYRYDQLNRLKAMQRHESFNKGYTGTWGSSLIYDYAESIAYDANGNITRYKRYASTMASPDLDSLTYHYPNGDDDNRLGYVSDAVPYLNSAVDIDDQSAGNYQYDAIGNLISDASEGIDYINWTVYGKIKKIGKKDGSTIEYDYDAAGNRIVKRVKPKGDSYKQTTYYFRDAQGNVLGVYNQDKDSHGWTWMEQHLYGSSRLGMWLPDRGMENSPDPWSSYSETMVGSRRYELTNHLGNVLAVISDGRDPGDNSLPDILQASDYYPFGMPMAERSYTAASSYRYGFNGKENDNEVKGEGSQQDYGMRIYDPRLGRFLSVDPLLKSFPWYSPYHFAGDNPVWAIDLDGLEPKPANFASSLRPGLTLINIKQANEITNLQNNPMSLSHPKSLDNVNKISILEKRKFSEAEMALLAYGTESKIGLNQNPILSVKRESYKSKETIEELGTLGKYLKTESESTSIFVDISKSLLSGKIIEIKTTTTTTVSYTEVDYVNPDGSFATSLNSTKSTSSTKTTTVRLALDKDFEKNLAKLPEDLCNQVADAVQENKGISERAIKGIYDAPKKLEKDATDGKLIRNKGNYYSGQNTPTTNGQNN